ncbi:hypothetical protein G3O08_03930 [Cryomorpha ignava]|uniref:PKD/Chitinase domain-containing protein n=1 Tax=Cryomorpha ignava TaxID=101383 RepID=A0A7K3WMF2_9FLAO|nr:gliding motility-associated C-terminal domain-containing protein [Cryomorpha ignava]NEN22654.1 hypothetical protein [Cryomorpha ignava]
MKQFLLLAVLLFQMITSTNGFGQILFMEDCFKGGVTTGGMDNIFSGLNNTCEIKWEENYTLRAAYALTYRYGRPEAHSMIVNGAEINWNTGNQAGPEQVEPESHTNYFAPHAINITNSVIINNNILSIDFPVQNFYENHLNWSWCGIYIVILYESPTITENVCTRIYIADQSQVNAQHYLVETPKNHLETPVLFAIHSSRLSEFEIDKSGITLNDNIIGTINGPDSINPLPASGVQGHFFYENGNASGLNGDSTNNNMNGQDGVCIINEYLDYSILFQGLDFYRIHFQPDGGWNPHPSFNITYTPTCPISTGEMLRSYSKCLLQSPTPGQPDYTEAIEFSAISGYDHYVWTPAAGLSNTSISNPICNADSSGWYRVRMWNDDEDGACAQTIPVFLTVGKVPRPQNLEILPSTCPANTGKIIFGGMDGKAPFQYTVNGETKTNATFENLAPGGYELSVQDALGCSWDSTVVLDLSPFQTAAFTANPDSGYSPLQIVFQNQSTNATSYVWLIDGVPFSTSPNYTGYTFADTGTFNISLIAYRIDETCADTAFATIRVAEGLKMIVPNIITPNNDGRNDALVVQTGGVAIMQWEIRNRWGNLLHNGEATNPPPALTLWTPDDQYPDGIYTVIITARGNSGEVKDFGVQVVVSRKP